MAGEYCPLAPDLYSDPLVVFPLEYALSDVRDQIEDGTGEVGRYFRTYAPSQFR